MIGARSELGAEWTCDDYPRAGHRGEVSRRCSSTIAASFVCSNEVPIGVEAGSNQTTG